MAIQLTRSLVLTHLLFPEAFGLMALVSVIMQGLAMCSDMGLSPNIIQSQRAESPVFLQTAWTLQILRGFCLWLMCCACAWPATIIYNEPALAWLLPICGLNLFIAGFHSTGWPMHDRAMLRARITLISWLVATINLVALIALAWWLRSVWALVIGALIGTVLRLGLGFLLLPSIKHRFRLERSALRELIGFGKWILLSTLLTFFAMQLDRLMLGRLIPMATLGVYSIALVLANVPRDLLQALSSFVLLPVLSEQLRTTRQSIHETVIRAREVLLRIGLLICLGVAFFAPAFFHLYDDRYADAAWIAQLLAFSAWVSVLNATTSSVLLALGDSKALAVGNMLNVIVTLGGALTGFHFFSLSGFIIGYSAGTAAGELTLGLWMRRYHTNILNQDASVTFPGLAATAMYLLFLYGLRSVGVDTNIWVSSGAGVVVWLLTAFVVAPAVLRELVPDLHIPVLRQRSRMSGLP